jgi:putative transposase
LSFFFAYVMLKEGDIMPRQPRQKSETGIYHVMVKGIDERNIFLEDGDKKKFMSQLLKAKEKGSFALLAYCLMDNHVHLLLEEIEELGIAMKRINVGYVLWYNHHHGRTGRLLWNRYRSEPVEKDSYLMTVARYIHQNPVKAGLVIKAKDYPWSSYLQYIEAYNGKTVHIDTKRIMDYFNSQNEFEAFMNIQQDDNCLEYQTLDRVTDRELAEIIQQNYEIMLTEKLTTEKRNLLNRQLYENEKTSLRQLARVLGVSKGVIERAL